VITQDITGQRITKVLATLKFVETRVARMMDIWSDIAAISHHAGGTGVPKFPKVPSSVVLPHRPSDYFRRNVMIGAAFPAPSDAAAMRKVGLDRIMWGSDYPHMEACSPHSKESLRRTFAGWSPDELRAVLSENAARVYKFDLARLSALAAEFGPTVEELAEPLHEMPDNQSPAFSRP